MEHFRTAPAMSASTTTIRALIAADLDLIIDGQSGYLAIGWCEGDPAIDDLRQQLFYMPVEYDKVLNHLVDLEIRYGDIYARMCLFQKITETTKRGEQLSLAADYAHAMPSRLIWKDDCTIDTPATRLTETSEGNNQALIVLNRPATVSERQRLMVEWKAKRGGDACSADAVHFIRLAGGRNTKPGKGNWRVRIASQSERIYNADKLLARCGPERESTHAPEHSPPDWQNLPDGEPLWQSPRWQTLATRQRPQLKTLLIDKEPIALPNARSGRTDDASWSNQRAVFVRNALEAYDPPPLEEIRAVAWYFREYLGERKSDRQYQIDIDRLIGRFLHELYTQREKVYTPQATRYIPGLRAPAGVIIPRQPRGRAGNHAALVERVYAEISQARSGNTAQAKIGTLASTIGIDRRTISSILVELREAGRIEKPRQVGQHGGLLITFSGMIYSPAQDAEYSAATPETDEITAAPIESTRSTLQEDPGGSVFSPTRAADPTSFNPPTPRSLPAAVELVLSQVDRQEFGRQRLTIVRQTLAVLYGYTNLASVNREIKRQESIFCKERRDCQQMMPDDLFARINARTRAATRNAGKRQEGKYRMLLQIADEVRQKRGLTMPEKPTTIKPVPPQKPKRATIAACQPIRYEQPKDDPQRRPGDVCIANLHALKAQRQAAAQLAKKGKQT